MSPIEAFLNLNKDSYFNFYIAYSNYYSNRGYLIFEA